MRPNQTAPNPSHIKHIPTIDEFGRSRVELIKNSSHWFMIYSSTNYAHFIASLSYYCVVEKKKNKKKNRWKSSFEWITITFAYMLTNDTDCNHYHFFSTQIIEYSMQILRNFNSQIKKRHHHLVGSFQSNPRFFFSVVLFNGNFDEIFDDLFQLEHYLHSLSRNAIQCWIFLQFVFVGVIFFLYI